MNTINELMEGFTDFFNDPILFAMVAAGAVLGTVVGLLPGLGPSTAIALLIPLALTLDPSRALVLMVAIYLGAEFGGRVSSILLNMPGDAGAIMTTLDGYPLAQKGRAATALTVSAVASFIGSIVSIIGLIFLAAPLSAAGLAFGPSAYFAVMVMALVLSGALVGESLTRGAIAVLLGLMIATIGIDLQAGTPRFTFGFSELLNGIDPIIPIIGLFGIGEILWSLAQNHGVNDKSLKVTGSIWPRRKDLKGLNGTFARGSGIGFFTGVLPGAGTTLAAFLSYSMEQRVSKTPEEFGKGSLHGVAAPEAANNAAVGGAMVPLLTLGIPGSGTTAVLLAYLTMYGLDPGPGFFSNHGDLAWVVIASMLVTAVIALVVNVPLIPAFAMILQIPRSYLFPTIMVLALVSGFALNRSWFDAGLVLLFGVLGYAMRLVKLSPALLVIGLVLGSMLERNLRQAYLIAHGSVIDMLFQPLTVVFLSIAVLAVVGDSIRNHRVRNRTRSATQAKLDSLVEE